MWYIIITLLLAGLDQAVKLWVRSNMALGESRALLPHICQLTYVQNRGAAFSSMQGMRWFFVVITLVFLVAAFWYLLSGRIQERPARWALVVILGGAVGNLIDRALFGYVVDMFDVLFLNFAVFNVADIFVVCGGIFLCVYLALFTDFMAEKKEPRA